MRISKKHKISEGQKELLRQRVSEFFGGELPVCFAYLYGSFIDSEGFNDIDLSVYIDEGATKGLSPIRYQLDLAVRLERELKGYSIDCRALNTAPLSFRFSVITAGGLLFSRDEEKRVSFESMTRNLYFDFKPHAELYYKKAVLGV